MVEFLIIGGIIAFIAAVKDENGGSEDTHNNASSRSETVHERQVRERECREALRASMPSKNHWIY